jgi:hypothetical protein
MKSRLFIRALCVGAALLVPAGGLSVLAVGTAGATQTTTTTSKATLGTLGLITLKGKTCTTTVVGTHQCSLNGTYAISGTGAGLTATLKAALLITVKAALTIKKGTIKTGWVFTIGGSATTTFKGCKITVNEPVTFGRVSAKVLSSTITIAKADIVGTATSPCTTAKITTLKNELSGSSLSSTITF